MMEMSLEEDRMKANKAGSRRKEAEVDEMK
jgi:hypothetical protein